MTQINPPFDGGAPCPMCNQEVRGISALVHNFLVRWPTSKAFVKLNDLRRYSRPTGLAIEHAAVTELLDVADALIAACEGMMESADGLHINWTPEVTLRVGELVPRAEAALSALEPLSDEHWRDARHSHGEPNVLRESQGSHGIRFLRNYSYHYTVEVVPEGADLTHAVCGTGLKLHQHFKDALGRDPTFYGRVWCPKCTIAAPFDQFARASR